LIKILKILHKFHIEFSKIFSGRADAYWKWCYFLSNVYYENNRRLNCLRDSGRQTDILLEYDRFIWILHLYT